MRAAPILSRQIASISGYEVFIFRVLQHGSTLLGTLLLAWWTMRCARRADVAESAPPPLLSPRARALIAGSLLAVAALVAVAVAVSTERAPGRIGLGALPPVVGRGVRSGLQALGCGILLYGIAWRASAGARRRRLGAPCG